MIDFTKHNFSLPKIAYELNIYPQPFDHPSFIDVTTKYLFNDRRKLQIEFNFDSSKVDRNIYGWMERNKYYVRTDRNDGLILTFVYMIFNEDWKISRIQRDGYDYYTNIAKMCFFWHFFINETFFKVVDGD